MARIEIEDLYRLNKINETQDMPTDRYVYHYTKRSTGLEKIMQGGKLRLGSIVDTNDPYETDHFYLVRSTMETWDVSDIVNQSRQLYKVLCTSQDQPVNGIRDHRNITRRGVAYSRMWAQYAENHEGVCLIFDREKLDATFREELGCNVEIDAHAVEYVELPGNPEDALFAERFCKSGEELNGADALKIAIGNEFYVDSFKKELFFQKSFEWETECEYRWIVHNKESETTKEPEVAEFVPIDNAIVAIIVGARCSMVYVPTIKALCEEYDIAGGRISWMNGAPFLSPL